jgi:5-methylcytosine-specific restriction protein B
MTIPSNIKKEDLLKAINKIDIEGIPKDADYQYYYVYHNEKKYPPKLVVSYANIYANGSELDRSTFEGGLNRPCFKLLEKEGFKIVPKNEDNFQLPRIFIAPRSGEQSSNNFKKTIEGGYKKSDLINYLTDEDLENLKDEDILMIWGNKPKLKTQWGKMQKNDWVIFYQHGKITYVGKLLYKSHNKLLSDNLWGEHRSENGDMISWEYVYFLKDLKKVEFNYKKMADYAEYRGSVVQGFQPYSEKGIIKIINKYGNLENFFFNIKNEINSNINEFTMSNQIKQFINAIKTKPFILLAGISGTGKSRLVRSIAYKTCNKSNLRTNTNKPGNFEIIPVKSNWHDSSDLLGYVSRLNGEKYISTPFLKFIAKAWNNLEIPFFLCLDEMNLAPVEQYLAEYLSILETRQVINGEIVSDYLISKSNFDNQNLYSLLLDDLNLNINDFADGIGIPNNLVIIGTVNMDETTHSFSRKVLDRAMTFEMNSVDLNDGLDLNNNDWMYPDTYISKDDIIGKYSTGAEIFSLDFNEKYEIIDFLKKLNFELNETPFKIAYRVRDEFLIYCYYASLNPTNNWLNNALDEMTYMKILSRIEGDENKTRKVLDNLIKILNFNFKNSNAKIIEMQNRLDLNGYTSFWS